MRTFTIETYGCQMNFAQSSQLRDLLVREGFQVPEEGTESDIIIINACSVRQHAEEKVFQRIRYFNSLKKKRDLCLMVIGCFAQNRKDEITADFIIGPSRLHTIPALLRQNQRGLPPDTDLSAHVFLPPAEEALFPFRAMVDVMKGCDHFCTYCIVPFLRGRQTSRRSGDILFQIRELAEKGVIEIVLLGQNINNYGSDNGDIPFAELLRRASEVPGIRRIRFLTSHPKDFTDEIIDAVFSHPVICPSFHLPLQSGSDRILKLMNRDYTRGEYLSLIEKIRSHKKEYSLSTDFLVGFPGETEEDFRATVETAQTLEFNQAFLFKYSPRPGTAASRMKETADEKTKTKRLEALIKIQKDMEKKKIMHNLGKERNVLTERESRRERGKLSGRDELNYTVIVDRPVKKGDLCRVRIKEIRGATLIGELI